MSDPKVLRPFELVRELQRQTQELAAAVVAADWNNPASVADVRAECELVAQAAYTIEFSARTGLWKRKE